MIVNEKHLNFNVSTFGSSDPDVEVAVRNFWSDPSIADYPLNSYHQGRALRAAGQAILSQITHSSAAAISASGGCSSLFRTNWKSPREGNSRQRKFRVLTSMHEHEGALAVFRDDPDCEVFYLTDIEILSSQVTTNVVSAINPDLILLSHVLYDLCWELPIESILKELQRIGFTGVFLLDSAQSAGNLSRFPNLENYSFPVFALFSLHKWIRGPRGTSAIVTNDSGLRWTASQKFSSSNSLDPNSKLAHFETPGGHDFGKYAGITVALEKWQTSSGNFTPGDRLQKLSLEFIQSFCAELQRMDIALTNVHSNAGKTSLGKIHTLEANNLNMVFVEFANASDPYPIYSALNDAKIHVKCIKKTLMDGTSLEGLRLSWSHDIPDHLFSDFLSRVSKLTLQVKR